MFYEKAKMSLKIVGQFAIDWKHPNECSWDKFKKVMKLDCRPIRLKCSACNGYHFILVRTDKEMDKDERTMCSDCLMQLAWLVILDVDKEKIMSWMKSFGEISALKLIQEKIKADKK